jgi:hypothetical protein
MKSNEICGVYESSYRCADVASLKLFVINCIVALRAMRDVVVSVTWIPGCRLTRIKFGAQITQSQNE